MRCVLLLVLVSSVPIVGHGAEPPPIVVPRVIVSGDRPVADVAAPSTVINRSQLQDAVTDLPEVLDEQPGLRVSRIGGLGSFSLLSVRGSTSDQVLIFVDGIPLNSAEGGPVDLSTVPLGPIDRVVVYRGMSPAVFGGSAIGGVVSIETRSVRDAVLEVEAGGGSFGTRAARAFYGDGGERWDAGVSVDYSGSQGDYTFLNDGGTAFDTSDDAFVVRGNNAFDQLAVMVKAGGRVGALKLKVLDLLTWRDHGLPGHALVATTRTSLVAVRNLLGLRAETDKLAGRRAHLSVTPYLSYSRTQLNDPLPELSLRPTTTSDQSFVPGMSTVFRMPLALDEDAEIVLTPTVSAEYRYERFVPELVDGPSTAPSQRHFATAAAEVELLAEPVAMELVASARVEHVANSLEDVHREQFEAAPDDADDTVFTWRAGLIQRPRPDLALKANVSQSARFGSLYELFGDTGYVIGNPGLRPETALNADFGAVYSPDWVGEGAAWSVEVYGFVSFADDLIQFVQNSQNVAVAQNVDSARIIGVEAGTFLDVLSHLRFRGSLTWMDARNTSDIKAREGKRLPNRPELMLFGTMEGYHRFGGWVGELGAGVEVESISGNMRDFANLVEVPSRLVVGASAYVTLWHEQLRLTINARNLTDDQVQDFAGFPLPGFNMMATLRWTPKWREEKK